MGRVKGVALLLVDVINDMVFPGSGKLVRQAVPMARRLARLKARAARAGVPVIYINDNHARLPARGAARLHGLEHPR
jgi:nicotinamidase-related amidase